MADTEVAYQDIALADKLVSKIETEKREQIKSTTEEEEVDFGGDSDSDEGGRNLVPDPPRVTDIAASSDAAPASTPGERSEDHKTRGDGDTHPSTQTGLDKDHPKKITMKQIPTNLFVKRVDKRTYEWLPPKHLTFWMARLLAIRRKAIEEHLDTSGFAAEEVYVEHEYQSCIRNALEDFWEREVASENGSPWQTFLAMAIPGVASGACKARMYRRNWKQNMFGKEWVFDFFVAFGTFNNEMLAAMNEALVHRAGETQGATVPASSREEADFGRLSERNQAKQMGVKIPPVQGLARRPTLASEFRSCASRKRSSAAGNDCKKNKPEGIVARAVRKYLAAKPKGTWQHVRNWITGMEYTEPLYSGCQPKKRCRKPKASEPLYSGCQPKKRCRP